MLLKSKTLFHATTVTTILGNRGCGKTYLSRKIQELYERVIIIDTTGEYQDGVICHNFDEFALALEQSLKQKSFRIIFASDIDAGNDEKELIDHCIRLAIKRSAAPEADHNNLLLVLEEVQNYSSTHSLPGYMRSAYLVGRHYGLALLATSQRPAEVHKTIISQSHNVFAGRCFEVNDIKYLSGFLNEKSEELLTIEDQYFLLRNQSGISKIHNDLGVMPDKNKLKSKEMLVDKPDDRTQDENVKVN